MTCTTADIINSIPGIEGMTYLELGVQNGATFDAVKAHNKLGVDISTNRSDTREMTTDHFFESNALLEETYDIIYIDADHDYPQPLTDYNNAVRCLRPKGLIFMHDLIPPTEGVTAKEYCSDAYRALIDLFEANARVLSLDHNFGLSVIFDAKHVPKSRMNRTYDEFMRDITPLVTVDRDVMVLAIEEHLR